MNARMAGGTRQKRKGRRREQKRKEEITSTHKIKMNKLSKGDVKLDSINPKKVVHNISSRSFTKDEESILSKGLQFCIETKIKNPIEFKTEIEMMAFRILKQLYKRMTILNVPSALYPTISAAVAAASNNDIIEVAAGSYIEHVNIIATATLTSNLTLLGAQANQDAYGAQAQAN